MRKCFILISFATSVWSNEIDIMDYAKRCSPTVAPSTMIAIIKTESNYNPLAININNKGQRLRYQARSTEQAIMWVNYLENHNYNFDVGLGQVNIKNIKRYGYHARDLLEPCLNLKISGHILTQNYNAAKNKSSSSGDALLKAISAYNTGNYRSGFSNGYVKKVVYNAKNSAIKQASN